MDKTAAIELLEREGFTIVKQHGTPDQELASDWKAALAGLQIARDRVRSGARLKVRHPAWMSQTADQVELLRDGVLRMVDEILSSADVIRENADAA